MFGMMVLNVNKQRKEMQIKCTVLLYCIKLLLSIVFPGITTSGSQSEEKSPSDEGLTVRNVSKYSPFFTV